MLDAVAKERLDGRVEVESIQPAVEKRESDFPVQHTSEADVYVVTLRITGTQARYAVPIPVDATAEDVVDLGMLSRQFTEPEVRALEGYAGLGGDPPVNIVGGEPASSDSTSTDLAWTITPLDPAKAYMWGWDVLMLERPDGTYVLAGQ